MTKHTPEPWEYGFPKMNGSDIRDLDCQVSMGGCLIANVSHGPIYPAEPFGSQAREANARRIVACVNACRTRTTEQLEMDDLQGYEPWGHVEHLNQQRDGLLAELKQASTALNDAARQMKWVDISAAQAMLRSADAIDAAIAKAKSAAPSAGEGA